MFWPQFVNDFRSAFGVMLISLFVLPAAMYATDAGAASKDSEGSAFSGEHTLERADERRRLHQQLRNKRNRTGHNRPGWLAVLPDGSVRVVRRGIVYYLHNGNYYRHDEDGYTIFNSPPGEAFREVENLDAYPDMPGISLTPPADLSLSEQANDRAQCHYAAVEQSRFDPTLAGGGIAANEYARLKQQYRTSMITCLQGRGYGQP